MATATRVRFRVAALGTGLAMVTYLDRTAMGQKNMVMEAVAAGAKDFIVKPFQPEKVLEAIQKIIG